MPPTKTLFKSNFAKLMPYMYTVCQITYFPLIIVRNFVHNLHKLCVIICPFFQILETSDRKKLLFLDFRIQYYN